MAWVSCGQAVRGGWRAIGGRCHRHDHGCPLGVRGGEWDGSHGTSGSRRSACSLACLLVLPDAADCVLITDGFGPPARPLRLPRHPTTRCAAGSPPSRLWCFVSDCNARSPRRERLTHKHTHTQMIDPTAPSTDAQSPFSPHVCPSAHRASLRSAVHRGYRRFLPGTSKAATTTTTTTTYNSRL